MSFKYDGPRESYGYLQNNYWGTTSTQLIDAAIHDFNDDFNLGKIEYQPILTTAPETAYPFMVNAEVRNGTGAVADKVGAEPITLTVTFNRDMDTAKQPAVSFGPAEPYTDYVVPGQWMDARTWQGLYTITPITGDGMQSIRVAGAVAADDPWLVTGNDYGRFRFEIITSGTEAMTLQATGRSGRVELSWSQDDFDLLAGYNIYRSSSENGSYSRINSTLVPAGQSTYVDTSGAPSVIAYYKFTVVKTDFSESGFSNVASAAPLDNIPPVITHTPITTATPGLGISIFATITDNIALQGATLSYRKTGTSTWNTRTMVHGLGDRWSASLEGSLIVTPGLEYSISATDGLNQAATPVQGIAVGMVSASVTAANKVYDGSTAATLTACTLTGVVAPDVVGCAATFADADVGNGKTVTASGITLIGAQAAKYTLSNTTASVNCTVTGVVSPDVVTCAAASASFADSNVGNGKTVTASWITLAGANAARYTLSNSTATTTANITAKPLAAGITAANKVYNGGTTARVNCMLTGVVAPDVVTCAATSAMFADANAGNGKTVTASGITLAGAQATRYTLSNATATTTANILPRALTASVTAADKDYDGTNIATITGCVLQGVLGADAVECDTRAATARFADAAVGDGKRVTVKGLALNGASAGNYTKPGTTFATASIAKAPQKPLLLAASATTIPVNGKTELSVSGGNGIGAVTYRLESGPCALSRKVLTGKTPGACVVTATKAGDARFKPVTSTPVTVSVVKAAQRPLIVISAATTIPVNGNTELSISGGNGLGAVTYRLESGPCTLNRRVLTGKTPGACVVTATKAGDTRFEPVTSAPVSVTVQ